MRVTVDDGRIVEVEPLHFDGARWAHETIDVSACLDEADVLSLVGARWSTMQVFSIVLLNH